MVRLPLRQILCVGVVAVGAASAVAQGDVLDQAIDFEKHVAPILTRRCANCHNESERRGKLDLTSGAAAHQGGRQWVAGNVDASYLIQRLRDGEMPPADENRPLTAAEIATLERWIAAGANWPEGRVLSQYELTTEDRAGHDWWSLQPVVRPAVPSLDSDWVRTPIDAFVLEKLRQRDLEPSPPADRRVLLRRVTFDLTGLPPTLEEADAFLADTSPDAFERLVQRLLASPHYGERWGRHWLDVAHYADTHGFERDFRRDNAWPYRDYVIAAFNDDKPYNDFIREQVAGDVLAPDDPEKVIATGFLAAGPWDLVGHTETQSPLLRRQARAGDLDDIVTTVISSTIGLTVNCSRCHDHKFDPIPQTDYYRLSAVLAGVQRGDRGVPTGAHLTKAESRLQEIDATLNSIDGAPINLADIVGGGSGFGTGKPGHGIDVRSGSPTSAAAMILPGGVPNKLSPVASPFVDGVLIPDGGADGKTPIAITSTGIDVSGLTDTSAAVWDHITNGPIQGQHSTELGGVDYGAAGHSMIGLHANKAITFDLAAIRRATSYGKIRFRGVAGYAGSPAGDNRADVWIYVDGEIKLERRNLKRDDGPQPIDIVLPETARFLTLVATDGGNGYSHDQVFFGDPILVHEPESAVVRADDQDRRRQLLVERDALRQQLAASPPSAIKTVYAAVAGEAPPVHVLYRGDTELRRAEVTPGALSCVTPLLADLGDGRTPERERRLALADWIVNPANPLSRRVLVNRIWHYHFGIGIVPTPSDFGFHGGRPSHAELLDWMADEFLRRGWSIKELHRIIVLSSTYQQSSAARDDALAIDADNRLLWRHSPRRLEVEAVRDAVLATSGKLNRELGGPGYRDFQFVQRYAPIYRYVTADRPELWRRTVYRFTVRSVPNPFMEVLDCPDPSNFTPVRNRTTTALQSLALLNNEFMVQQAGHFAERVQREAGDDVQAQIERAWRLALARRPDNEERRLAAALVDRRGLFSLCRMLFNANEFVYVD